MKANELLLWMSARGEGSWRQFRAGVDELYAGDENDLDGELSGEFSRHQRLRQSLDCLAHAEFFARECEEGWRVVPPTLAVRRTGSQFVGLLCGARTLELLHRIATFTDDCRIDQSELFAAPDRVCVMAETDQAVVNLANIARLRVQHDAPLAILMHIPRINSPPRQSADEFPVGADWIIHEFNTGELRWREVTRQDCQRARQGLFRFRDRFQTRLYFTRRDAAIQKVGRGIGIFQALRAKRRGVLAYSRDHAKLNVPAICRPPRLLERALVLCSGRPPSCHVLGGQPQLSYEEVPADIAALAAELLGQTLR